MNYKRAIQKAIIKDFFKGRVIVVIGARRVGKTTLVNDILDDYKRTHKNIKVIKYNCDDPDTVDLLKNRGLNYLQGLVDDYGIIFVDEVQKLPSAGNTIKLLVDYYKNKKQIIISGSSSLNILDQTSEPLTGRKYLYYLYPLSFEEIVRQEGLNNFLTNLDQTLIYGVYPDVYLTKRFEEKIRVLDELTGSYLYKDIIEFQEIKQSSIIRDLLKAIALQIGSQVSYSELANIVGIDKKTVIRYIDLLEKNFILFRLPSYSKNQRREISRSRKIYFYDNGVRNEIINDFRELKWRQDTGALWENFIISERIKFLQYQNIQTRSYFWRTYDGKEIDYVEEYPDKLLGYEIKYSKEEINTTAKHKFLEYDNSELSIINKFNFIDFIKTKTVK